MNNLAVIILAAGEGTRLNHNRPFPKPKVLYELVGKPMIFYTLETVKLLKPAQIIIVVGYQAEKVMKTLGPGYNFVFQERALGTANAAECTIPKLRRNVCDLLVLNGDDSAFYTSQTLKAVIARHQKEKNVLTFVTLVKKDPFGLGRIIRSKEGKLLRIVEEKVATEAEKKIREVNIGCYLFNKNWFAKNVSLVWLSKVGEYYLTDMVEIALKKKQKVATFELKNETEWVGINNSQELEIADRLMRKKISHLPKN